MSTGIIILAAGNSSRMGNPKQLLDFNGNTFLEITISAAEEIAYAPIVLVLGAYATEILAAHPPLNINYIINENWSEGMSSSIKVGLTKLMDLAPTTNNLIITVSDQPFISSRVLISLLETHTNTGKNIIASQYAKTIGTPVLFNKKYFDELKMLEGSSGAKQILSRYTNDVATVPFELGRIDIDTESDYKNLTTQQ